MIWLFSHLLTPAGRVLRKARRLIQRKGWCQGRPNGAWAHGGACVASAITQAGQYKGVSYTAMDAFALHNQLPSPQPDYTPTQRTTSWNDTPGRTQAEVIQAFRKAEKAEAVWALGA